MTERVSRATSWADLRQVLPELLIVLIRHLDEQAQRHLGPRQGQPARVQSANRMWVHQGNGAAQEQ